MAITQISRVKTAIKSASDGITADGDYLILNAQVVKSGKVNVRCAGMYGPATVSVGYIDSDVFNVETQPDSTDASFTDFFSLKFECGEHTNKSDGPAIQVSGMDGTTDLSLTISNIE